MTHDYFGQYRNDTLGEKRVESDFRSSAGMVKDISLEQFKEFDSRLHKEIDILQEWFNEHHISDYRSEIGYEIEFFLLDKDLNPTPKSLKFIKLMDSPFLVSEVGASQLEFNTNYYLLTGDVLAKTYQHFNELWDASQQLAIKNDYSIISIGTLPNVAEDCHHNSFITNKERYHVMDQCMAFHREGRPIELNISGKEHLHIYPESLAMDGLICAFHIHLRVGLKNSVRMYNAAQIAAAPSLAISCNAPYMFGKELWEETRVTSFDQVMTLCQHDHPEGFNCSTFGNNYVKESLFEIFDLNYQYFPRLLPMINDSVTPEEMWHIKLHNGCCYRWNRPVIDFDPYGYPHLRIEHRAFSSGPTIVDMIANGAFFIGLVTYLANQETPPETMLSFYHAKKNFYEAARKGMDAKLIWLNNLEVDVQTLILNELLPLAEKGLELMKLDSTDIKNYLGIIERRVLKKASGSAWQRNFISKNGKDFHELLKVYLEFQNSGKPVSDWTW